MTGKPFDNRGVSRRRMLQAVGSMFAASVLTPTGISGSIASTLDTTAAATSISHEARMRAHLRALHSDWCMTDASYCLDPRIPSRWDQLYRELIGHNYLVRGDTVDGADDEPGFWEWWARVMPPPAMRSRSVWEKLDPLSRRYQWLDAMFEAALHQYADAWWDHELISRKHRYRNYSDPEVRAARKRKDIALRRVRKVSYRILQFPALSLTDRFLRRRAIEVQELPPWEFAYKYRRAKILAQIRNSKLVEGSAIDPA